VVSDSYASTSYRVGIIQTVDRSIGEDSKKILHVEGQEAKALLSFRMVDPGTSSRYTSSAVFETAVKAFVNSQCGATATDANRVFPGFTVALTQGRGAAYVFSERWSNLSEAVQKACINVTTGYTIYWSGSGLVFDTLYGVNRTLGNNVNNPAIFSTDFDTVKESHFTLSKASYKNYVYAGGQGVGTARVIQPVFSGATAPSGYLRREMFADARDLSATADLTVRGTQELTANSYQQFTEAVINPYATFSQSSGVDLGDLCTVDAFGYQTTEQWSGAGYDCSLTMDRSQATVESVVANEKYVANRAGSYIEITASPEYAYNTNVTWTTQNDTSSFGYGTVGSALPNTSTSVNAINKRRVRFLTPGSLEDVVIQIQDPTSGKWMSFYGGCNPDGSSLIMSFGYNGTYFSGIGLSQVTGSATDIDFLFCQWRHMPSQAWDATTGLMKWRLFKR
jgi:hypothetical protein